jgi:TatD DNase family protein
VSPLVDAHCHLADGAFDGDRRDVLDRARGAGVEHVVVIGESLAGSERAATLARATPGLSATAGVHPHEARTWDGDAERALRRLLAHEAVVAVGETGLDYHYDHSPRAAQRIAFEAQLALAAELQYPIVVHAREADADLAALLREWAGRIPAVVLHSFSSGDELFAAGMAVGAYFSFSGMITFRSWTADACVTGCPADRLLVETDAPYLSPVPHRGHRNEPAFVREVATTLARRRGETLPVLADQTTENARRVFGRRLDITFAFEEKLT